MISAYRRGIQTAAEEATKYTISPAEAEIRNIATKTLAQMRKQGFAHLDPEEDFIRGFIDRFHLLPRSSK